MKKIGVMNSDISRVIANMGHMDWLSIGDAGMPVPRLIYVFKANYLHL